MLAELAIFRAFSNHSIKKVIYVAPNKQIIKLQMKDWGIRLGEMIGKKIVELKADSAPDISMLISGDLILTTI